MTVLGEAFIEVKADLKPFVRNLNKELKAAVEEFERRLDRAVSNTVVGDAEKKGRDAGGKLGDGFSDGFKRRVGDKKKSIWVTITAALASALDDGISALPAEAKAAIVAGIIAALPILSAALAGAVTAGLGAGFAGVGALIAFQYDEVRERGTEFAEALRLELVDTASEFVPVMLRAFDVIEKRFQGWAPMLSRIFGQASKFVDPLVEGALDFVEELLKGIEGGFGETALFVQELRAGLKVLGIALGEFFKILANTGESGREGFRDLIFLTANLVVNLARIIAGLTEIYHGLRVVGEALGPVAGGFSWFIEASDRAAGANVILVKRNHELAESTTGVIKLTDDETKRLKELEKALKDASDATYDIIESQVDFERSLDNIKDSLEENGKTLDIGTEKGRRNVEEFIRGLKAAQKETEAQVALGKLSDQQAAEHYRAQIAAVQKLASEAGITGAQFQNLFGDIISVAQLKVDAEAMGLTNTTDELAAGVTQAALLYSELQRIRRFRLPPQGTRPFSEYAEGGIVNQPTQALIGEAGAEVVIPMTKPARAAELLRMSGLDRMLTPSTPNIQVFVGNEQLDARTYRIVTANNESMSNSLAFGARGL